VDKNYVDYFIEIMTNTLSDAVVRNVSLQANAKITDVAIGQLNERVIELENEIESFKNNNNSNEEHYKNQMNLLNEEVNKLRHIKNDYDNIKNQATNVDTFRNELIKARKETADLENHYEKQIQELKDKIEYLQLTPAKRKKMDEKTTKIVEEPTNSLDSLIKDGGSF
jgi:chromosome segregation ATPase